MGLNLSFHTGRGRALTVCLVQATYISGRYFCSAYRTRRFSAEFYMLLIVQQVDLSIHTSVVVTDDRSNSFNYLLWLQLLIYNHF